MSVWYCTCNIEFVAAVPRLNLHAHQTEVPTSNHCVTTCPQLSVMQFSLQYHVDNTSPPHINLSRKAWETEMLPAWRPRAQIRFPLVTSWSLHQPSSQYDIACEHWSMLLTAQLDSHSAVQCSAVQRLARVVIYCENKSNVVAPCGFTIS
jgi:hypothetical protein